MVGGREQRTCRKAGRYIVKSGVFNGLGSEEGGEREVVGQRFDPKVLLPSGTITRTLGGNRNSLRWATGKEEGEETLYRGEEAGKVPNLG